VNRPYEQGCVITVGKFEAIHLGHRALIEKVINRAKETGHASVVVIFRPHPFTYLRHPDYKPIFTIQERVELLTELGVEHVMILRFDSKFAARKATQFCSKLTGDFKAREIVVGEGYRFGHNREGTVETLKGKRGLIVHAVPLLSDPEKEVASQPNNLIGGAILTPRQSFATQNFATPLGKGVAPPSQTNNLVGGAINTSNIRKLLEAGNFRDAAQLLGFPFFVAGEVTKGRQLGRVLGFPTLNIYPPPEKFLPENGVYETNVIVNGVSVRGITNVGLRPTVTPADDAQISVETHIPSFNECHNMYGKQIKVEFLRFIRPECKFETVEELQLQIARDLENVKENQHEL